MSSGMNQPANVTAASATKAVVAVGTASVLLTGAPVRPAEAATEGLNRLDELLKCRDDEPLRIAEIAEVWRNVTAAVIERNARIRSVRATARRLDRSAGIDLAIPSPLNIIDHDLCRIGTWCRHADAALHEARIALEYAALECAAPDRVALECAEGIPDVTFASSYIDALDIPVFDHVFSPSDHRTVARLRRVVDGDDVLDDELRATAESLRQRASIMATQDVIRVRAEEALIGLGYEIIDSFGTRAAGLVSLTLSHPAWSGRIAAVAIGGEEIGGKILRAGDIAGDHPATAEEELYEAFQEDMRHVGEMLRFVGVPDGLATGY